MFDYLLHKSFKHLFLALIVCALGWGIWSYINTASLLNNEEAPTLTPQENFINFILQRSETSNEQILQQRQELLGLYSKFENEQRISLRDRHWLAQLAAVYQIKSPDFSDPTTWDELVSRVDVIPNSLVIAQAIQESGWGQSRFAKEGNNYFGMWCYGNDCGGSLVPDQRAQGQDYALQTFSTPLVSVQDYMRNLNTHFSYQQFRDLREKLREQHDLVTGLALAPALVDYSGQRGEYVVKITRIIRNYSLTQYDDVQTVSNSSYLAQKIRQQFDIDPTLPLLPQMIAPDNDQDASAW